MAKDYYADLKEWKLTRKSSLQRYYKQGQNEGLVAREQVSTHYRYQLILCELSAVPHPTIMRSTRQCGHTAA
jgi:hypothetical protein